MIVINGKVLDLAVAPCALGQAADRATAVLGVKESVVGIWR